VLALDAFLECDDVDQLSLRLPERSASVAVLVSKQFDQVAEHVVQMDDRWIRPVVAALRKWRAEEDFVQTSLRLLLHFGLERTYVYLAAVSN